MAEKKPKSIPSTRPNPTSRFAKRLIIQIVDEVEHGLPRKDACAKYGMAYVTLDEWMVKFGSPEYHADKRAHFSIHQRRDIVRKLREGRMTIAEASLFCKTSKKTISAWLRQAKKDDNDLAGLKQQDMAIQKIDGSDVDLQNQLAQARLKIKALETMIDIAEEQFKIAIRKKPGAKQ